MPHIVICHHFTVRPSSLGNSILIRAKHDKNLNSFNSGGGIVTFLIITRYRPMSNIMCMLPGHAPMPCACLPDRQGNEEQPLQHVYIYCLNSTF